MSCWYTRVKILRERNFSYREIPIVGSILQSGVRSMTRLSRAFDRQIKFACGPTIAATKDKGRSKRLTEWTRGFLDTHTHIYIYGLTSNSFNMPCYLPCAWSISIMWITYVTAVTTRLKFEQTSIRIRDVKSLQTFVNIWR